MKIVLFILAFMAATVITLLGADHLWAAIWSYGILVGVPMFHELHVEGIVRLERYHHKDETPLQITETNNTNSNRWG